MKKEAQTITSYAADSGNYSVDYTAFKTPNYVGTTSPTENLHVDYTAFKTPNYVGGYRLGNGTYYTQINFTHKPNWFHRTMMRLCFGFEWVNEIK